MIVNCLESLLGEMGSIKFNIEKHTQINKQIAESFHSVDICLFMSVCLSLCLSSIYHLLLWLVGSSRETITGFEKINSFKLILP